MTSKPAELIKAGAHLATFEQMLDDPRGIYHLSEGLEYLAEVIIGEFSQEYKSIAQNVAMSYSELAVKKTDQILSQKDIPPDTVSGHYLNILEEFRDSGISFDFDFKEYWRKMFTLYLDSVR